MKKFISSLVSSLVYGIFVLPALFCYLALPDLKVRTDVLFVDPTGHISNIITPIFSGPSALLMQLIIVGLIFWLPNFLNNYNEKITNIFTEHFKQSFFFYLYLIIFSALFLLERRLMGLLKIIAVISLYAIVINMAYILLKSGESIYFNTLMDKFKKSTNRQCLVVGALFMIIVALFLVYLRISFIHNVKSIQQFWNKFPQTIEGKVAPVPT